MADSQSTKPDTALLPDAFAVQITAEDIQLGKPLSARWCPLARALRREFPLGEFWIVTTRTAEAAARSHRYDRSYHHDGQAFVRTFDAGEPVEPCTVTLTRIEARP